MDQSASTPEPSERALPPAIVAALLTVASLPALRREAARRRDPRLFWMLLAAHELKLCGAVARYHVAYDVYGGSADAEGYHAHGRRLARRFRAGDFDTGMRSLVGTGFIRVLTGVVYTLIGPSRLGGFLVFSSLGFWGLLLFNRAFALAVPEGRSLTYARLVFFLPSHLFWPSSIGKEAWMLFSLGTGALGGARVLSSTRDRAPLDAVGVLLASRVRPHVAVMLGASLSAGYLLRGRRRRGLLTAALTGLVGLRTNRYLLGRAMTPEDWAGTAVEKSWARTSRGGSSFTPPLAQSRTRAPLVPATVLFRPHPREAHNPQALAAAAEASFLLALSLARVRWAAAAIRHVRAQPYVASAAAFTAMFIAAFSGVANFGILARQRSQVLPFYLVLLSVPPPRGGRARRFARP
ncbi:MAG: hypothetical protein ACJ76S_05075 [Solirubrobacteraceae bacterium]